MISWNQSEEGISFCRPKLTKKTEKAFFTPPPRVVEGWNLHVWQWIFELHSIVACKPAQLLQNRHFVEKIFRVLTKNFSDKRFCRQKCLPQNIFVNTPKIVSAKCLFWRSCAGLDVTGRCASKIHCQTYRFQPSRTLGGGVRKAFSVFFREFWPKNNLYLLRYDTMLLWYYDIMILWYYGMVHLLQKTDSFRKLLRIHLLHFVVDGSPIYYTALIYYT